MVQAHSDGVWHRLYVRGTGGVFDSEPSGEVEIIEEIEYSNRIEEFAAGITWHNFFGYEEGVYSPGVILQNTVITFTDFLHACVEQGLESANAPEWVVGFICDGILGGLFSVISFLPQILLLFLFFSILENSGYMARVAFILDRLLRKF